MMEKKRRLYKVYFEDNKAVEAKEVPLHSGEGHDLKH
jgi:hypothetical protein